MQKFNTFNPPVFNLDTGFKAGNSALREREGFGKGTADTSSADGEKAAKKLQEEIKAVISAIEKEAESFGKSRLSVQLHTLAIDGATFAQRQHALAVGAAPSIR